MSLGTGFGASRGDLVANPRTGPPTNFCLNPNELADLLTTCLCCKLTDFRIRFFMGMVALCRPIVIVSCAICWPWLARLLLFLRGNTLCMCVENGSCQGTTADVKGPLSSLTIIIEDGDGTWRLRICSPSENLTLCLTYGVHAFVYYSGSIFVCFGVLVVVNRSRHA